MNILIFYPCALSTLSTQSANCSISAKRFDLLQHLHLRFVVLVVW